MGDPRYPAHLDARRRMFEHRAQEAWEAFQGVKGVKVIKPQGAFYMSVMFEDGVLNGKQTLEIENSKVKAHIEEIVQGVEVDKRFVYYLLGATGICVVPLTGFCCNRKGFRVTLLETDDAKRLLTWRTIVDAITRYLASA
jgi:aspartate/methionine/tyrosine aminotransferase